MLRTIVALLATALLTACPGGPEKLEDGETTELITLTTQMQSAALKCQDKQPEEQEDVKLDPNELAKLKEQAQVEYLRSQSMDKLIDSFQTAIESVRGTQWGECDAPYRVLAQYIKTKGQVSQAQLQTINRGLAFAGIPLGILADKAGTAMIVDKANGNQTRISGVKVDQSVTGKDEATVTANGTRGPVGLGGDLRSNMVEGQGTVLEGGANQQSLAGQSSGVQGKGITDPATQTDPGDSPSIGGQGNRASILP